MLFVPCVTSVTSNVSDVTSDIYFIKLVGIKIAAQQTDLNRIFLSIDSMA